MDKKEKVFLLKRIKHLEDALNECLGKIGPSDDKDHLIGVLNGNDYKPKKKKD